MGVALDELFVNIHAHQGNGLLLQILRLGDSRLPALGLDHLPGLVRGHHAPHLIKGIHVKGQGVQFPFVVCHRGIGKTVKRHIAVYIAPDRFVVGVENMGAVFVKINALHLFGVHIAADVASPVNDQDLLPRIRRLTGKHRAVKSRADHQIIVFHKA